MSVGDTRSLARSLDSIAIDLIGAAEAPLVLVNNGRRLVWATATAARLFDSDTPALIGRRIDDLSAATPAALDEICRSLATRGYASGLVELFADSRDTRPARFCAISLRRDLHLAALYDASRSGRRDPTPSSNVARQPITARIAAAVGHEIRGPLATALLYVDIALKELAGAAADSVEAALRVARQQIQRVESLVSRTVEMQRLGRAQVRASLVDAGRVVSEAVRRMLAGDSSPHVVLEIGAERLVDWWDETALEQIVQNLLSNALKFGEGRPVHVALDGSDAGMRLTVRDNGVGIAAPERERIFNRNVRAPHGRSGGLGLGLWLVRELAEAHEGRVTVESQIGMGSVFTVTLRPLRPTG